MVIALKLHKLETPTIQVALDFTSKERALSLARVLCSVDSSVIIEAGTPLIKATGVMVIKDLRATVGEDRVLLADMKTIDVGALEAELAFKNNADITTVLGLADNITIESVINVAERCGKMAQVDLINVDDPVRRGVEVASMGAHIIGLHAGIDVQRGKKLRAVDMVDTLRELRKEVSEQTLLSIAGGIKPENVKELVSAGADIIVIGSAITASSNPKERLLEALKNLR